MARVENLSPEELGAILQVCGRMMLNDGLMLGTALDGESCNHIRDELAELLDRHDSERLDELACIDPDQVQEALNDTGWGI